MKIGLRGGHSPYCKGAIRLRDEQECVRRLSYEVKKLLEKHGHTILIAIVMLIQNMVS